MNPVSMISPAHVGIHLLAIVVSVIASTAFLSWLFPLIMDRLLPPPVLTPFYTFLPFRRIHEDGKTLILNTKSPRHYIRVIAMTGTNINLSSEGRHYELFSRRKQFLDSLEVTGITSVKMFTTKERIEIDSRLKSSDPVLRQVQANWIARFPNPTEITHYLVLCKTDKSYDRAVTALDEAEAKAMTFLADYRPRVLSEFRATPDGLVRTNEGPLRAFAAVLSPISRPSPTGLDYTGPLSALVNTDEISFAKVLGAGVITFTNGAETLWSSVITYRDCGENSTEAVPRELLAMDAELIIYHAIEPIPSHKAFAKMKYYKQTARLQHGSNSSIPAYDTVLKKIEGTDPTIGRASMINHALHIIPLCKSRDELERVQRQIQQIMSKTQGTTIPLKASAQTTFLSMLDPNVANWPRRFRLPSDNVAATLYPQSSIKAHIGSDWSKTEPVAWLPSVNGEPFPFNFHIDARDESVGHTVLIGRTGGGKTTFITLLAALSQRIPDLKCVLLDRLNGMKIFTTCVGGDYLDFAAMGNTGIFNPLHLKKTPQNRAFLQAWLKDLTDLRTPDAEAEFARMVDLLYREDFPAHARSLKKIVPIALSPTGAAARAMEPWINDQQYGRIFNADKEPFNLAASRVLGYDMTQVLENDRLAGPVVSYLIHSLQNIGREKKTPTLLLIDETKPLLRSKDFAERLFTVVLQEARKQRQVCVLNFQSAQAIADTGKADLIFSQCKTQIFFRVSRNESDMSMDAYRDFGLNSSERDFVLGKTFEQYPHAVLIKRDGCESVIANIDISRLGNYTRIFKSGEKSKGVFEDCLNAEATMERGISRYIHNTVDA